jgi:hypothetical protein
MTTRRNVLASTAAAALIPAASQAAPYPSADAELLRLGAEFDRAIAQGDLLWGRFCAAPYGSDQSRAHGDECEAFWPLVEDAANRVMATPPATLAGLALWARVMTWRFDPTLRGIPAAPSPELAEYGVNEAFALAAAVARIAAAQTEGRSS